MYNLALIHGNVYVNDRFQQTNVYIDNGKIALLTDRLLAATKTIDCTGLEVLPGVIDPHTHMELDLGFIQSKDDFYTGSVAGAYGGGTTIIDFVEPSQTREDLENAFLSRMKQAKKSGIDYKVHSCLKDPVGLGEIVKTMGT